MNYIVAEKSLKNSIRQSDLDAQAVKFIIEKTEKLRDLAQPIDEQVSLLRQISRIVLRMSWSKNAVLHANFKLLPWTALTNLEQLSDKTLEEFLASLKVGDNLNQLIIKLTICVSYADQQMVKLKQQYADMKMMSEQSGKISILTQVLNDKYKAFEHRHDQKQNKVGAKRQRTKEQQQEIEKDSQALRTVWQIYSQMDLLKQHASNPETYGMVPKFAFKILTQLNPAAVTVLRNIADEALVNDLVGSLMAVLNSSNFLKSDLFQHSWFAPLINDVIDILDAPAPDALGIFFSNQHKFVSANIFVEFEGAMPDLEAVTQILNIAYKPIEAVVKDPRCFSSDHRADLFHSLSLLNLFLNKKEIDTPQEAILRGKVQTIKDLITRIVDGDYSEEALLVRSHIREFFTFAKTKHVSEDAQAGEEKPPASDPEYTGRDWELRYRSDTAKLKHCIKGLGELQYNDLAKYKSSQVNLEAMRNRYDNFPLSSDKREALDKLLNGYATINEVLKNLQQSTTPEQVIFDIIKVVREGRISDAIFDDNGDISIKGQIATLRQVATHASTALWIKEFDMSIAKNAQKVSKSKSLPEVSVRQFVDAAKNRHNDFLEVQKMVTDLLQVEIVSPLPLPGHFVVLKEDVLLSAIEGLTPTLLSWQTQLHNPIDIGSISPEEILRRAYHKQLIELALQLINQVCFPGALEEQDDLVAVHRLAILRVTCVLGEIFHEMRGAPYYSHEVNIEKVSEWRNILQHFASFKNSIEILSSYVQNGWVDKQEPGPAAAGDAEEDGEDKPAMQIETVLMILQHDVFNKGKFSNLSATSASLLGLAREYMLTFAGGDLIRDLKLCPRFLELSTLPIHTGKLGILAATDIASELQLTRNKYSHAPLISSMTKPSTDQALLLRMFGLVKTIHSIEPVKSSELDLVQNCVVPAMQLCWVILFLTKRDGSLRDDLESRVQNNMEQFARVLNLKLNKEHGPIAMLEQIESRINKLVVDYGDPNLQALLSVAVAKERDLTFSPDTGVEAASAGVGRFGLFSQYCGKVLARRSDQWHQLTEISI